MKNKKLIILVALLLIFSFFTGSIFSKINQRFYEVQSKYVYSIYHKFVKKKIVPLKLSPKSQKEKRFTTYRVYSKKYI